MSVYVDKAKNTFRKMKMSHMFADSFEELHLMAKKLKFKRAWFQSKSSIPHYDVCQSKRKEAIKHGAIEIDTKNFVLIYKKLKNVYKKSRENEKTT